MQEVREAGVSLSVDGVVATITLDRPQVKNAQQPAMWAAMAGFLDDLADEVRVVVVRGAGGTFSAGLDLSLFDPDRAEETGSLVGTAGRPVQEILDTIDVYQRPFAMLTDPRFISIAVVDGYAIGAGFQLALCCDLRIVAEDASFCMKEPALGLVPDLVGTKPLVVVPRKQLDETLAATIAALTAHSLDAVRATKALLQQAPGNTLGEQRLAERTAQAERLRALAGGLTPAGAGAARTLRVHQSA